VVKNTPDFAALKRAGAKRGTAEFGSTDAEERAAIAKSIHELVKTSGLTMEEFIYLLMHCYQQVHGEEDEGGE